MQVATSPKITSLNESIVEDAALTWFGEMGYAVGHGPHLAPGEPAAERDSFSEVVQVDRLREAIRGLNPAIPEEARAEALRKMLRVGTPSLTQTNRALHRMLRDGVPVEYPRPDGSIAGDHVRLVDYLGLADQLKKALITYTESGGQGDPTFDTAQAIAVMLEKHGTSGGRLPMLTGSTSLG